METVLLPGGIGRKGMGWLPDRPDVRDFSHDSPEVHKLLSAASSKSLRHLVSGAAAELPASVDLREWFSPVEDQLDLNTCTANAACGIVEYFQRRSFGKHVEMSRLFLYKVTREFAGLTGDTGAYLRTTMGALALFGVPPEQYWPYDPLLLDENPPAFCFAFAQNYQALTYFRLDSPDTLGADLVTRVKNHLAAGVPSMFGLSLYGSIANPRKPGDIPYPAKSENAVGGHALVAVGYDDGRTVQNPIDRKKKTGAFLVRNSWGLLWGDGGYGWLPYDYARQGLAEDWWAMTAQEWVETSAFDE
ncbi:C1 family peptidase [Kibdelosporangium aridum]|uniref:C1 family peptidase n=1 Tax=Kibdelosporangium aridum TaxID=2030 RepID=UPI0035EFC377